MDLFFCQLFLALQEDLDSLSRRPTRSGCQTQSEMIMSMRESSQILCPAKYAEKCPLVHSLRTMTP